MTEMRTPSSADLARRLDAPATRGAGQFLGMANPERLGGAFDMWSFGRWRKGMSMRESWRPLSGGQGLADVCIYMV